MSDVGIQTVRPPSNLCDSSSASRRQHAKGSTCERNTSEFDERWHQVFGTRLQRYAHHVSASETRSKEMLSTVRACQCAVCHARTKRCLCERCSAIITDRTAHLILDPGLESLKRPVAVFFSVHSARIGNWRDPNKLPVTEATDGIDLPRFGRPPCVGGREETQGDWSFQANCVHVVNARM